ncbi:HSP20-like chaperone [Tribonema minus]|uniref:HSP20-like chaperone n=1 Tax=Tribonema minus TaxID=303371 RepID=A0A836C9J5_9STRA|nr:HSP20-like chaperone [Tribonema minus]
MSLSHRPQDRFRTGFDRLLQDFENDFLFPTAALTAFPLGGSMNIHRGIGGLLRTDLQDTETAFEMKVDMPGVSKEEININVDESNNSITITTERKEEKKEETEGGWLVRERTFGKAQRTQVLPQTADLSKAQVELKDGTLHFTVPKREVPGSRTLSIK